MSVHPFDVELRTSRGSRRGRSLAPAKRTSVEPRMSESSNSFLQEAEHALTRLSFPLLMPGTGYHVWPSSMRAPRSTEPAALRRTVLRDEHASCVRIPVLASPSGSGTGRCPTSQSRRVAGAKCAEVRDIFASGFWPLQRRVRLASTIHPSQASDRAFHPCTPRGCELDSCPLSAAFLSANPCTPIQPSVICFRKYQSRLASSNQSASLSSSCSVPSAKKSDRPCRANGIWIGSRGGKGCGSCTDTARRCPHRTSGVRRSVPGQRLLIPCSCSWKSEVSLGGPSGRRCAGIAWWSRSRPRVQRLCVTARVCDNRATSNQLALRHGRLKTGG